METKIKILIVEHDVVDLELIDVELQNIGFAYESLIVQNEQAYINALSNFIPDIILADYTFPSFDGPTALKIRERVSPGTPFIFVSGTIGEEKSIELIRGGVTDYALKDKLFTLNHKILRALIESKANQQKKRIEKELIQSERRLSMAEQMAHMGNWELNFATNDLKGSDEVFRIYGLLPDPNRQSVEFALSFIHSEDVDSVLKTITEARESLHDFSLSYRIRRKNGSTKDIYAEGKTELDATGNATGFYGIVRDVTDMIVLENKIANERLVIQKEITHAVLTALENERSYIGNELNENLSQILATAKMYIQLAKGKEEKRHIYLDMSYGFIQEAMTGIKRISKALVIPGTHIISLSDNIKNLIHDLSLMHPLNIEFRGDDIEADLLNEKLQLTIFRIVQEQLNNILIHSGATKAEVKLKRLKKDILLFISDNGEGCDILKEKGGVGIINIKTRAELHDGKVAIVSTPGNGYELKVKLSVYDYLKKTKTFRKKLT
ncbi:MAG: PAS domain-containing protein [Chitinophagaceae bacterium]